MTDIAFSFEENPWDVLLAAKQRGDVLSAVKLLAMLENEDEETVEDFLQSVMEKGVILDISELPKAAGSGEAALRLRQEESLVQNGLNVKDLDSSDPLRLYLEEVAALPAAGDENVLALRVAEGDMAASEMLTRLGLSRVISLASENVGRGVLLMDLIQEGSLGLWQAIQNYRDGSYAAFRDGWIRNCIAKAVFFHFRSSGIGQKLRGAMEDYRAVDERLLSELGRNPTQEEIAQQLHMTFEETAVVKKMLDDARMQQRNQKEQQPPEPTVEDEQAVEDTAYFQSRQRILELLSVLSEEDASILTLRFGLEKGVPLSPEETGKRLGMTPQEVVAREAKALAQLRGEK